MKTSKRRLAFRIFKNILLQFFIVKLTVKEYCKIERVHKVSSEIWTCLVALQWRQTVHTYNFPLRALSSFPTSFSSRPNYSSGSISTRRSTGTGCTLATKNETTCLMYGWSRTETRCLRHLSIYLKQTLLDDYATGNTQFSSRWLLSLKAACRESANTKFIFLKSLFQVPFIPSPLSQSIDFATYVSCPVSSTKHATFKGFSRPVSYAY